MNVFIPLVIMRCRVCPYCGVTKNILKKQFVCFHPIINDYGKEMNIYNPDDVASFCPLSINKETKEAVLMLDDVDGHWSFAHEKDI